MNVLVPPLPTASEPPIEQQAARLYRRVCLLRLTGDRPGADRLAATELAVLLPDGTGAGRLDPARWQGIVAREDERLADAQAIAELLGPLLASRLSGGSRPAPERPPAAPAARPVRTAPAIADLLDDMLALDRT